MKKKNETDTRETVVNSLNRPCSSTADAACSGDRDSCICFFSTGQNLLGVEMEQKRCVMCVSIKWSEAKNSNYCHGDKPADVISMPPNDLRQILVVRDIFVR